MKDHINSSHLLLGVSTTEEARAMSSIVEAVTQINKAKTTNDPDAAIMIVVDWSPIRGFSFVGKEEKKDRQGNVLFDASGRPIMEQMPLPTNMKQFEDSRARDPIVAMDLILGFQNDAYPVLFVMKDLDNAFSAQAGRLRVKSIIEEGLSSNSFVLVLSAALELATYPKLANTMTMLEFDLPSPEELEETVRYIENERDRSNGPTIDKLTDDLRERIVTGLRGLTSIEAENALSLALVKNRQWTDDVLDVIRKEKARIISQSEALTFIDLTDINAQEELGGYNNMIDWLQTRRKAYSKQAREEKLDLPKGLFLVGVPGSGKSVAAKTAAKTLGLPLFILDIGAVFGGLVGQSEANLRRALRQVTAQGGCVLMVDEIDKGLNQAHTASGDSGTTSRVFGAFLSWLANKKDNTFVFVTANRINGLPPELLRAGRFDILFYTDLPTAEERRDIIDIHLKKRGIDTLTTSIDEGMWNELVRRTENFVGSELEQVVINARYLAFDARNSGVPTAEEWLKAVDGVTPLYILDKTGVEEIRTFCKERAVPVNGKQSTTVKHSTAAASPRKRTIVSNNSGNN